MRPPMVVIALAFVSAVVAFVGAIAHVASTDGADAVDIAIMAAACLLAAGAVVAAVRSRPSSSAPTEPGDLYEMAFHREHCDR